MCEFFAELEDQLFCVYPFERSWEEDKPLKKQISYILHEHNWVAAKSPLL